MEMDRKAQEEENKGCERWEAGALSPSLASTSSTIQEGDLVVVYEGVGAMKAVRITSGGECANKFGRFKMDDWIGRNYGCKVWSVEGGQGKSNKGKRKASYIYLLAPTPELWTCVLPHRTQILYVADISLVISCLNLVPGSIVLETGTGSGSLTHSLARTVGKLGRVLTYDFHEERRQAVEAEIKQHRLDHIVKTYVRDTQCDGFPVEEVFQIAHEARSTAATLHQTNSVSKICNFVSSSEKTSDNNCASNEDLLKNINDAVIKGADGVFLDLPRPYEVITSCHKVLKFDGRIASFSPCMEQVQTTCSSLKENGFIDIRTVEILLRYYNTRREALISDMNEERICSDSKKRKRDGNSNGDSSKRIGKCISMTIAKPLSESRGHTGYLTFARKLS